MIRLQDYRKYPAVNISTLKQLYNPRWVKWRLDNPDADDEEKAHFRIGGAIDTLLTNKHEFNNLYTISDKTRPGGLMAIFIDNLPLDLDQDSDIMRYEDAYIKSGYKLPLDLIIKRLWESDQYKSYYLHRKVAADKTILTSEEYEQVHYCSDQLLNNAYTRQYFNNINPNVRLVHQAIVLFEYSGVACKGALDGIMVNYADKTIRPFDLKTTYSTIGFKNTFTKHGYYLQGAFYVEGLKKVLKETPEKFLDFYDLPYEVKDYDIDYMRFIVTEKRPSVAGLPAFIFTTDKDLHNLGVNGGSINGRSYKGFTDYLDAWKYHLDTDYWEYSKEYIDNKGEFLIELE